MSALDWLTIWLNDLRQRLAKRRYRPENVLLLLPHCLQNQHCNAPVKENILLCKGCGRCKIKDLKAIALQFNVRAYVASGGRMALNRTRDHAVRAIVAVACTKELGEGIRAAFPKRVAAVINLWPNGPCVNTDVDLDKVKAALETMIEPDAIPPPHPPQSPPQSYPNKSLRCLKMRAK